MNCSYCVMFTTHLMLFFLHRLGTYNETSTQFWYNDTTFVPPTETELAVSKELMARWTSFAKTGDPNNNNYRGWEAVPFTGANRDGRATEISQFYFSLNQRGFMSNSASKDAVIDRCSAFPNWSPFAMITETPTYSPTSWKSNTRRPTRHPTK